MQISTLERENSEIYYLTRTTGNNTPEEEEEIYKRLIESTIPTFLF